MVYHQIHLPVHFLSFCFSSNGFSCLLFFCFACMKSKITYSVLSTSSNISVLCVTFLLVFVFFVISLNFCLKDGVPCHECVYSLRCYSERPKTAGDVLNTIIEMMEQPD